MPNCTTPCNVSAPSPPIRQRGNDREGERHKDVVTDMDTVLSARGLVGFSDFLTGLLNKCFMQSTCIWEDLVIHTYIVWAQPDGHRLISSIQLNSVCLLLSWTLKLLTLWYHNPPAALTTTTYVITNQNRKNLHVHVNAQMHDTFRFLLSRCVSHYSPSSNWICPRPGYTVHTGMDRVYLYCVSTYGCICKGVM